MLPRIFSGAILSIGCVVAVQVAENVLDSALDSVNTAHAAPTLTTSVERCAPAEPEPCPDRPVDQELPPDVAGYVDCLRELGSGDRTEPGRA